MEKCTECQREFGNKKGLSNHYRWHDLPAYKEYQIRYSQIRKGVHQKGTKGINLGQSNGSWLGEKVGYWGVHSWVKRNKPKSTICENCETPTVKLDLANISGEYRRDILDFEWLCRACHMQSDGRLSNLRQYTGVI